MKKNILKTLILCLPCFYSHLTFAEQQLPIDRSKIAIGETAAMKKPIDLSSNIVKLTEVEWHGTDCYKIEMPMGTVYFEKGNGVSGFKSFIDNEGNDWVASYLPPEPKGEYRGFSKQRW